MSLWPLITNAPCFHYSGAETCPVLFGSDFFYDPGSDRLIYHSWFDKPLAFKRYDFDAATGLQLGELYGVPMAGFVSKLHYITDVRNMTTGSYGKIYAWRAVFAEKYVSYEIDPITLMPATGGYVLYPYYWTGNRIYFGSVINREDNIYLGIVGKYLELWRNINSTPVRYAVLLFPSDISYVAYESRNYCWVILKNGIIAKIDYQIPRYEMISQVDDPGLSTLNYMVTFDTKRHRVVVFRERPNAWDGACQHQLEIYYPMVKPYVITQPVPVTSLRGGNRVLLAANLIGDAGEGMTPYTVHGGMVPPVEGRLVTPFAVTGLNGQVCFQYQAPNAACTETLQLSVTVEES